MKNPLYKRVLLKLSGEAFQNPEGEIGLDAAAVEAWAKAIAAVVKQGVQLGIVVGGGNFCRGRSSTHVGLHRTTADKMGMLATVINALPLRDFLEAQGVTAVIHSALSIPSVVEHFERNQAIKYLAAGHVVIFAGGTGNPLVTTDTTASLRAIEIDADVMLKATKVDGVYNADPQTTPDATLLTSLTYNDVIQQDLRVMDLTSVSMCRDHNMPLRVFNMTKSDILQKVLFDEGEGTLIKG